MTTSTFRWATLWLALRTLVTAFRGSEAPTDQSLLAGSGTKTWYFHRVTMASGESDRTSRAERQNAIRFSTDGRFQMEESGQLADGNWTLTGEQLTLVFTNADRSETFDIVERKEDKVTLRAADGNTMELRDKE